MKGRREDKCVSYGVGTGRHNKGLGIPPPHQGRRIYIAASTSGMALMKGEKKEGVLYMGWR